MKNTGAGKTIPILFFMSGAAGLVYEILCVRALSLVFGSTHMAVSTVLAAFMFGLALGSRYFGWLVGRHEKSPDSGYPVKLYGYLALGCGIYFLVTPEIFRLIETVAVSVSSGYMKDGILGANVYRVPSWSFATVFAAAFLAMAIPTFLIGGMLPILASGLNRGIANGGGVARDNVGMTGFLYSINTWGAVFGTAMAGYFLINLAGVRGTFYVAAVINFVVAAAALLVAGKRPALPALRVSSVGEGVEADDASWLILPAIALSGATALAYEVLWTRALSMILGSSTYAFTTMLCAFLSGIALGSWIYGRVSGISKWPFGVSTASFGLIQGAIGVFVLALVPVFGILPLIFVTMFRIVGGSFAGTQLIQFAVAFIAMLAPTTLFGATLPLAADIYRRARPRPAVAGVIRGVGATVGGVYAANTVGAIAGALAAGFALIPWLGIERAIISVAVVNVALAIFLISVSAKEKKFFRYASVVFLVFFTVSYVSAVPQWNRNVIGSGVYSYAPMLEKIMDLSPGKKIRSLVDYLNEREILFYKDGSHFALSVFRTINGELALAIDGKIDASDSYLDMPSQLLAAHLPMILHKKPSRSLVIGLASGITLGAVLKYPVAEVDCVEIEPQMIKASGCFDGINGKPLEDSRVKVIIDDARRYLSANRKTPGKYDVIISQPSNPWMTGVAPLFTKEFMEIGKDNLADDGIMCMWFHSYGVDRDILLSIFRTFSSVFPGASCWRAGGNNILLIGSLRRTPIDFAGIERAFALFADDMRTSGIDSPAGFLGKFGFYLSDIEYNTAGVKPNTDNTPLVEFRSPKFVHRYDIAAQNEKFVSGNGVSALPYLSSKPSRRLSEQLFEAYKASGMFRQAKETLAIILRENPDDKKLLNQLAYIYLSEGDSTNAEDLLLRLYAKDPNYLPVLGNLSQLYLNKGMFEKSLKYAEAAVAVNPSSYEAQNNLGMVYLGMKLFGKAEGHLKKAVKLKADFVPALYNLSLYYLYVEKDVTRTRGILERIIKLEPTFAEPYRLLSDIYITSGKTQEAIKMSYLNRRYTDRHNW
jgi:spermidine synthase